MTVTGTDTITFNTTAGTYQINAAPAVGASSTTGMSQSGNVTGINIFRFDSIDIQTGAMVNVTGGSPLAIVSKGDFTLQASISVDGNAGVLGGSGNNANGGMGVAGGGNGGPAGSRVEGAQPGGSGLGGGSFAGGVGGSGSSSSDQGGGGGGGRIALFVDMISGIEDFSAAGGVGTPNTVTAGQSGAAGSVAQFDFPAAFAVVPEPGSLAIFTLMGLVGAGYYLARRRKR